jgi:ATP-binding cassette subfamily B protein
LNNQTSKTAKDILKKAVIGQKGRIFISSFLSVLASVIFVFLALISKKIIDIATTDKQQNFTLLSIAVIVVIVIQSIFSAAVSHFKTAASGKIAISIKKNLFTAVLTKNHSKISEYHSGDLLTRFSSDVDVVSSSLSSLTPSVASIIAKIISGAVAILIIDWKFASALIILGILVPFVCKLIGTRYKPLHKRYQQSESKLRSFLQESFKNMAIIKSFSSLTPTNKKLSLLQKENYDLKITKNTLNIIYSTGLSLFFTLGYFLVLLWGAKGIQANTVTYGALIAFLQIISQLRAPLQSISAIAPAYYSMTASAERLAEIYDIEDEILPLHKDVFDAINDVFTSIEADNLSFAYGDTAILENCSFKINRNSTTVITGDSGVGKSTLFRLLLGYLNGKGSLKFDGKYDINSKGRSRIIFGSISNKAYSQLGVSFNIFADNTL